LRSLRWLLSPLERQVQLQKRWFRLLLFPLTRLTLSLCLLRLWIRPVSPMTVLHLQTQKSCLKKRSSRQRLMFPYLNLRKFLEASLLQRNETSITTFLRLAVLIWRANLLML
jgi:hypothetical protein